MNEGRPGIIGRPFDVETICDHEGFHAIHTAYDRSSGLLIFRWTCEGCGALLGELRRERYRPAFDPRNKDHLGGHSTVPR